MAFEGEALCFKGARYEEFPLKIYDSKELLMTTNFSAVSTGIYIGHVSYKFFVKVLY